MTYDAARSVSAAAFPDGVVTHDPYGRLYLTLQALRKRPLARVIRHLQACERLTPDEFDRRHRRKLGRVLQHAREGAKLYESGAWQQVPTHRASAGGEEVEGRLAEWPILEREVLRGLPRELQVLDQGLDRERTSGSTGPGVQIVMTRRDATWRWAQRYRCLLWHGVPIGVSTLRVSRTSRPLRDLVLNQRQVPVNLTPEALDSAAERLKRYRPGLVYGPPSALFRIARDLRDRPDAPGSPPAAFARVGGEPIYEFQRSIIEEWLADRVVDSYGCTEVGPMAAECPNGSLHVLDENVHVEIVRGDTPVPPGEWGDIVVTSLRNTAMPLIRYRVGDRGRLSGEPCTCRLPHPVLADLQARSEHEFTAADGSPRHESRLAEQLGAFFRDPASRGVLQVMFEQLDPPAWRVWIEVPRELERMRTATERAALESMLERAIRDAAGAGKVRDVHLVERIPSEGTKHSYLRFASRPGDRTSENHTT